MAYCLISEAQDQIYLFHIYSCAFVRFPSLETGLNSEQLPEDGQERRNHAAFGVILMPF
jgi:hypothetical protein